MYILTLDTSSRRNSCAISDLEGDILISTTLESEIVKSEKAIEIVDFTISSLGIPRDKISAIGVCKGPGSYMGVRIGLSTAMGLSKALSIPAYGYSSFEIVSHVSEKKPYFKRGQKFYIEGENKLEEIDSIDEKYINILNLELTRANIIARILSVDVNLNKRNLIALY